MRDGLILCLNGGSTSLKFALYRPLGGGAVGECAHGAVDAGHGAVQVRAEDAAGRSLDMPSLPELRAPSDHVSLVEVLLAWAAAEFPENAIEAVSHRIVHGGDAFPVPIQLTAAARAELARLGPLAPMHQPQNLALVDEVERLGPELPQFAVFDTSFHLTQAALERSFAVPRAWYDSGIRRFGFHGLSCEYVSRTIAAVSPPAAQRFVVAHLGGGCTVSAIASGQSVASSTGMTPVSGLPMATRSGDVDPGALLHLIIDRKEDPAGLLDTLYHRSGLLGLSGISGDVRTLLKSSEPHAREALDLFVRQTARMVAALAGEMGGMDALILTGGIGAHAVPVRAALAARLGWLGIAIDPAANERPVDRHGTRLEPAGARIAVWAIETDEERILAEAAARLWDGAGAR